jgi:hypothetical protein
MGDLRPTFLRSQTHFAPRLARLVDSKTGIPRELDAEIPAGVREITT